MFAFLLCLLTAADPGDPREVHLPTHHPLPLSLSVPSPTPGSPAACCLLAAPAVRVTGSRLPAQVQVQLVAPLLRPASGSAPSIPLGEPRVERPSRDTWRFLATAQPAADQPQGTYLATVDVIACYE